MHAPHFNVPTSTIALPAAWSELSEPAFAIWLRLMVVPWRELLKGRGHLARLLDMPPRTLDRRLRELRNKGYIRLVPNRNGLPTTLVITRRATIVGPSAFVKL